jgi:hypothetical protein
VGGQHYALADLPPERPGTHCTGSWVGPRAGLDVCEKSRTYRDVAVELSEIEQEKKGCSSGWSRFHFSTNNMSWPDKNSPWDV